MNQQELIDAIVADPSNEGVSKKTVKSVLDGLAAITQGALASGGDVTLPGIGKFSTSMRAARTGRNPQTGKEIQIASKRVVKFTALKALKDAI